MNARLDVTEPEVTLLNPEQAIGQIAVQLPGSTAVFRRLKLDFCCGGQISLRQAVADKRLDLDAVVSELSGLQRSDAPVGIREPVALIDHILSRYHEVHRGQLPELIRMARRVEAVHRDNSATPHGLADMLENMEHELLSHMEKEEKILFPMLKSGRNPFVDQPIGMMRSEHVGHGGALERVMAFTQDATPPLGACNTWRALYAGIAQFHDDLISHIHLENNVLFPQFEVATPTAGCCGTCSCS